jgi:hypothetical protein
VPTKIDIFYISSGGSRRWSYGGGGTNVLSGINSLAAASLLNQNTTVGYYLNFFWMGTELCAGGR